MTARVTPAGSPCVRTTSRFGAPVDGERHVDLRHDRLGESAFSASCTTPTIWNVAFVTRERRLRQPRNAARSAERRRAPVKPRAHEALVDQRDRQRAVRRRPRSAGARREPNADAAGVVRADLVDLHGIGVRRLAGDLGRDPHVAQRVQPRVDARRRRRRARALTRRADPGRTPRAAAHPDSAAPAAAPASSAPRSAGTPRSTCCMRDERAQQHARSREQHQRRAPPRRRRAPCAASPAASCRRGCGSTSRIDAGEIAAAAVQRRRQAADDARQRGHGEREHEHRHVERDLRFVRNRVRAARARESPAGRRTRARVPSAPAASASSRLSVSSWRTRRARLAPSAARTVISRCRAVALDSSRFETFAQAINEQQPDRAEQHPDVAGDAARKRLGERQQPDAPLLGKLGRLAFLQILDDRPQVRLGLRVGDAGLQPAEQVDVAHAFDDPSALERRSADRRRRRAT